MDPNPHRARHIIIIGGGIVGCTTAYYLSRHPSFNPAFHRITLLEANSIAAGASGKAGGLLGLWAYPQCIVPLSYQLHADLAAAHRGAERWGYRTVGCGQVAATLKHKDLNGPDNRQKQQNGHRDGSRNDMGNKSESQSDSLSPVPKLENSNSVVGPLLGARQPDNDVGKEWEKLPKQDKAATQLLTKSVLPADLDWVDSDLIQEYAEMGQPGFTETAQVHPFQFTTSMAALAEAKGVAIKTNARVTKILRTLGRTNVDGVQYLDSESGEVITVHGVSDVVVAAGPWAGKLIPNAKIEGLRVHSVVFEADVSPYAIFTSIQLPINWVPPHRAVQGQKRRHRSKVDPEIYARPGGGVRSGEPDSTIPLPEAADQAECDEAQCDDLISYIGTVSSRLGAAPVLAKQSCYIPRHMRFGEEQSPLVGGTSVAGLWIAAGHTCWGIQNGPATGKLMSEYIFDGAPKSANIDELDPRQYKVGLS
ncbi:FAD dependent oxidoreductase [Apiospora kogelbergensis]|uniref:FAD dependent oxidoreductase n=1 Tax=Apiospora kogelbergensis TaxID=1337665 RepID=UPI00312E37B3